MITIYAQLQEKEFVKSISFDEMVIYLPNLKSVFWIDLESPTDDDIQQLQDVFDFHPLCIEDCMSYSNAPKLDEFDEYLFLVTHEPTLNQATGELSRPEIDFFLGKNYLVSVHHHASAAIEKNKNRCQSQLYFHQSWKYKKGAKSKSAVVDNIMFRNSDFILHSILDMIVDNYFPLADHIDQHIDELEERILSGNSSRSDLNQIILIRRQLAAFRRTTSPQRDVIGRLIHSGNPAISPTSQIYFRDIYDHLIRVNEAIESHRDMIGGIFDAYYSILSNQLNENSLRVNAVMQRLTIITTIFMPLSFIAGVYGMNFENMPELKWQYGYLFSIMLMIFVTLTMYLFFRIKKWF